MKLKVLSLVSIMFLFSANIAYGAKPKTEQEWDKCRDKVDASYDQQKLGMASYGPTVIKKCGIRPVNETKTGIALLKSDCNWLYKDSLGECANIADCSVITNEMSWSNAVSGGIELLSEKAFNSNNLIKICKQVCESQKTPDKEIFEQTVCSKNQSSELTPPNNNSNPGNMVAVPKVDGTCLWSKPTTDNIIKSAGLKPKSIQLHGPEEGAGETGCAYGQKPKAGSLVKKGSTVTYKMWFEAG